MRFDRPDPVTFRRLSLVRNHASRRRWHFLAFVIGEILLVMAIPFVAIEGYHTLLDSRAGRLIEEPTRTDPGWRALVDATTVVGVAEVDRGAVTGVAIIVHQAEQRSPGTIVLVPASVEVDGIALADRPPDDAVRAVGRAIRLAIGRVEVLDQAGWGAVLGDAVYSVESPDPVVGDDGAPLFDVGVVEVDGDSAGAFVGRPVPGASVLSVLPRRHLLWNALLAEPPATNTPLASDLREIDSGQAQVVDLPVGQLEPATAIDDAATELLVRDIVAFPASAAPGDRLQVRVLDRTGTADLEDIAAAVAARGIEVIEIGNAGVFDDGPTEVIAPSAATTANESLKSQLDDLSLSLGVKSVILDDESDEDGVVTVIVGTNFDLANLY